MPMKNSLIFVVVVILAMTGCSNLSPTNPLTPLEQTTKQAFLIGAADANDAALTSGKESPAVHDQVAGVIATAQADLDTENSELAAGETVSAQEQQAVLTGLFTQIEIYLVTDALTLETRGNATMANRAANKSPTQTK